MKILDAIMSMAYATCSMYLSGNTAEGFEAAISAAVSFRYRWTCVVPRNAPTELQHDVMKSIASCVRSIVLSVVTMIHEAYKHLAECVNRAGSGAIYHCS